MIWVQRKTALTFCKEHGGMKKTLKENSDPFGFMAIYCLVLVFSFRVTFIFSNAAKHFLKYLTEI